MSKKTRSRSNLTKLTVSFLVIMFVLQSVTIGVLASSLFWKGSDNVVNIHDNLALIGERIGNLQGRLEIKDEVIKELETVVIEKDNVILEKDTVIKELESEINNGGLDNSNLLKKIEDLESDLATCLETNRVLIDERDELNTIIDNLKEEYANDIEKAYQDVLEIEATTEDLLN